MPHVSKHKIENAVLEEINGRLTKILADFTKQSDIKVILDDLLTKTERTMLAKRLAIILMLNERYPFAVISRALKVSEATISVMRDRMDRGSGGFDLVLNHLNKKKSLDSILIKLDKIINMFAMPPIVGKERWKFLDDMKK